MFKRAELREQGLNGILAVGDASAFLPCLLILRYKNNPESDQTLGLVGKGVTCDTGGYCLKSASSMLGMKGDMQAVQQLQARSALLLKIR